MSSREMQVVAPSPLLSHDNINMAHCVAVANRGTLPPFMPVGRGEDSLFGYVLLTVDSKAVGAHIPVGVVHDSDRGSTYADPFGVTPRLADLVAGLVASTSVGVMPGSPSGKLANLGSCLTDLGSLNGADFAAWARKASLRTLADRLDRAETDAHNDPYCPFYWREALMRYRDSLMDAASAWRTWVPAEFQTGANPDEDGSATTQRCVRSFGDLCAAWPSILINATDARMSGVVFGQGQRTHES